MSEILEKLEEIEGYMKLSSKAGLTLEEASTYTGIGRQSLVKIMYQNSVPFSKIGNKTIVFKKHLDILLDAGVDLT
ncbi:helix-turn-helix domain-containing protein [Peptoniphilus sp. GNH]|nr:helix-turn-helix domain-containing protein [Peptoniphilus sp. GNH]